MLPPPSKVETVHEIILKPDLSRFCVCFCIEESAPLFSLLGTLRQEPPLLLWCHSSVAPPIRCLAINAFKEYRQGHAQD